MMQQALYQPAKTWLESKDFRTMVTGLQAGASADLQKLSRPSTSVARGRQGIMEGMPQLPSFLYLPYIKRFMNGSTRFTRSQSESAKHTKG